MARNTQTLDGLPVHDAKSDTVITVTPRDIKGGDPLKPGACPFAKAACRGLGSTEALIYRTKTYLRNGKGWDRYCTPGSIRTELVAFDRGGRMMPGDHILRAPKGTERLGVRFKPTGPKRKPGNRRRKWHMTEAVRERGPNLREQAE